MYSQEHGYDEKLMNMALLGRPDDMVEAARYYEFKPGQQEKAVLLYHKVLFFKLCIPMPFLICRNHSQNKKRQKEAIDDYLESRSDLYVEHYAVWLPAVQARSDMSF